MNSYRKYIWAFLITLTIFLGVTVLSNYFDVQRLNEVRSIDQSISLDILSSEIQFDLLKQTPCEYLGESSLSQELDSLGSRLSYLENARGADDKQVVQLKMNYSLLEIKDFILMQSMTDKCKTKPAFVLYFYSNKGDCPDCQYMGSVLTALRQEYPDLRIYSFDYHSDISAVGTLEGIYRVLPKFPALVIHGKPTYGLKSLDEVKVLMPELKAATSTAATTTPVKK
jgi:thiol-disulfide isomerase/thioredoxin